MATTGFGYPGSPSLLSKANCAMIGVNPVLHWYVEHCCPTLWVADTVTWHQRPSSSQRQWCVLSLCW